MRFQADVLQARSIANNGSARHRQAIWTARTRSQSRLLHVVIGIFLVAGLVYVPLVPASATFPGSNGMFAFSAGHGGFNPDYQINLINPDGTGRHEITDAEGNGAHHPRWSPDGSKIAYLHQESFGGSRDIYVMNKDGSNAIKVGSIGTAGAVNWSRDASKLTYVQGDQVWTMNANGTEKTQVTTTTAFKRYSAFSPTSDRIYYTASHHSYSTEPGERNSSTIWSVNPDGSDRQLVYAFSYMSPDYFDMSPDGRKLAFVQVPCDANNSQAGCAGGSYGSSEKWLPQVHELDLVTGTLTQITNNYWSASAGNGVRYVTYSPDGAQFGIMAPGPRGYAAIYTLPVTGGSSSLIYETNAGDVCTDNGCASVPEALHSLQWQPCTASSGSCTASTKADLAVDIEEPREPVEPASSLEYTVRVSNSGPHTAEGISVVIDWTDAEFQALVEGPGCQQSGNSLTCAAPSLQANSYDYVVEFSLKAEPSAATVELSATASTSGANDPVTDNNSQTVRTTMKPPPVETTTSLVLRRHLVAKATVSFTGDRRGCRIHRGIIERRSRDGYWVKMDSVGEPRGDSYTIRLPDKPGKYRARTTLFSSQNLDECVESISPVERHRH